MIKNLIICSSVFLVFIFIKPGYADEHFPFLAEVSKQSVNVRSGPSTNFSKVDELSKGAQVVVVGRNYEWLKVQPTANVKCYIRSDYLQMKQGSDLAEVIGDSVNVRAKATSNSDSLGRVKRGVIVKVLAQTRESSAEQGGGNPGWSTLAPIAGTVVWIHQDFLKKVSDAVPANLILPQVPTGSNHEPQVAPVQASPVSPWVSMRGTVEVLVNPLAHDVHYEIVMDDKSVFLLQDIPKIGYFQNAMVNVEGSIVPDPDKKLMYPLLHINKITLVL